jgi:hypothetical protein
MFKTFTSAFFTAFLFIAAVLKLLTTFGLMGPIVVAVMAIIAAMMVIMMTM